MRDLLEALRDKALKQGVDFMDVRAVENERTSVQLQDGRADKASQGRRYGLGIRILLNRAWGFAAADGFDRDRAFDCLETAISMAKASQERVGELGEVVKADSVEECVRAQFEKDPRSVPLAVKMKALSQYEQAAVAEGDGKLVNTVVFYGDEVERVMVCNTQGTFVEMGFIRTRLGANMTALPAHVLL